MHDRDLWRISIKAIDYKPKVPAFSQFRLSLQMSYSGTDMAR